jgi:hypothetical protein
MIIQKGLIVTVTRIAAAIVATVVWAMAAQAQAVTHRSDAPSTASLIAEVHRAFTIEGKPIPPEIFRDFGDGDLADSGSIWVTVDIKAATGSNLYFDEIKQNGRWVSQKKKSTKGDIEEETGYSYYGTTENGLLVVLASYSGGGSGDFAMLHILDIAAGRALDLEGKTYERINLTNVRSIALGDRWDGEVRIAKSAVRIITTRKGPADDSGKRETLTIAARRP